MSAAKTANFHGKKQLTRPARVITPETFFRAFLEQMEHLSARLLEADERTTEAAIYRLNRAGGRTRELEEAWIIQALVREDGMSQVEVAELLGRHKNWVCRRLALIEPLVRKHVRQLVIDESDFAVPRATGSLLLRHGRYEFIICILPLKRV